MTTHGHAHKHFGADDNVKSKKLEASADMNVTPMIDVTSTSRPRPSRRSNSSSTAARSFSK